MRERLWDNSPILFLKVTVPACHECGHRGYVSKRGEQQGDGSTVNRCVCELCGARFVLVREFELPCNGDWLIPPHTMSL